MKCGGLLLRLFMKYCLLPIFNLNKLLTGFAAGLILGLLC